MAKGSLTDCPDGPEMARLSIYMGMLMEQVLSYVKDALQELARLLLATLGVVLLNFALLYAGKVAWRVYGETHTGQYFAEINPEAARLINEVLALTPYSQTSLELALAAMLCVLVIVSLMQVSGLLRVLYDPLPLLLRLLWPVVLTLLFALPYAAYDARLDSYQCYVYLLLPGIFCLFWSAMKAVRRLVPDISVLLSVVSSRR
ncbi:MAG: hypothetical protein COW19_08055 [Zetaproteobacteria bacterium CG12_big_fil_rev_8_21_14_0_65_55_1124]|nr:MAG: hypothetical protein AUJ58_03980 [Zetaproteobacteria bacterium CG1_02_55_237]PIW42417.1 MAG: hypothetical protein COW19_08055 [Zetaproteobacteria bacterium CG12_big_fil_rev_8_21_14_0_65_55_1124]PIZ37139.1 MAG: hypothetical protein COY36_10255 [Zetaproteobacteria bacterium CG_4_10_14_0_2_um_filter_55_20]PJB81773.1 MAG: hypothetical protein CO089_03125 [Zetaproteobacteria bacterium CG_4_9_14_0_8_um_filter_55_31]